MSVSGDRVSRARSILLVIADDAIRDAFAMLLRSLGYGVRVAATAETALQALSDAEPRLVLIDQTRTDRLGGAFLDGMRARPSRASVPVIVLGEASLNPSGHDDVTAVFPTPVCLDGLLDAVLIHTGPRSFERACA